MSNLFQPGVNCWRIEQASRAAILIDGENYFRAVRGAMKKAQQRIMLLGWDFDPRIEMHDTEADHEGPIRIGDYFDWLLKNNKQLHIHILRWDTGALKSFFRSYSFLTLARWFFHPRVHFKLDRHHPVGGAQHQKVIVIDRDTAFCSGIDIANNRWDTRAHQGQQEERLQPDDEDAGPWHDAAMIMQGDIAAALSEFAEQHWRDAGGKLNSHISVDRDCWPDSLEPDFVDCPMAISRTLPDMEDQQEVREIERLCVDLITAARDCIYVESQYFASTKIAAAMAQRLREKNGPEIVIVNPESAEGWLESAIMDSTRARLFMALKKRDEYDRLRMFHPYSSEGIPIYVHAKILIIDDRIIRVGSSNLNNRSLGFDSECDVVLDAASVADPAVAARIRQIRNDLVGEHLGVKEDAVADAVSATGSLVSAIAALKKPGRTLREYQPTDLGAVEEWLAHNDILDPRRADDVFAGIM
ncbi:MAG: phospholipase D-like domain-containing protein [Pseudomonadota bacterium]